MRVDSAEPGLDRAALEELSDAGVRETTLGSEPQPRLRDRRVPGSGSEVPVERLGGPCAEGSRPRPAALADDVNDAVVEVDVFDL
jgi:hypothetical protein